MSTPDISSRATLKLSPFGSGINKSLLTPCRRIGLSRKRKINSSVKNLLDKDYSSSDVSFTESPNVCEEKVLDNTPKCSKVDANIKSSIEKHKLPGQYNIEKRSKSNICRKKLEQSFSPVTAIDRSTSVDVNSEVNSMSPKSIDERDSHIITVKALVHKSDCSSDVSKEILGEIGNIHIKDSRKVEEDNLKRTALEKECKVVLRNFSRENINHKSEDSDDRIVVEKNKRKKNAIIDDDDDDFTSSPVIRDTIKESNENCHTSRSNGQLSQPYDKSLVKRKSSQQFKELESKKLKKNNSEKIDKKNSFIHNDDDDAFTSTPDRDTKEKENLINKIKTIETKLKEKREILQHLQQAAVYQKKHNIDELRNLKEAWRIGCVQGLHGLLAQLQTHSPMNMTALLNKLHIDNDTAKALRLEPNC